MLFVATHSHIPESCMVDNPAPLHQLARPEHAKECGVKVLGGYIAPPEHVIFFILDASDYASVVKFLRPVMKIGAHEITPVQTLQEATGLFPVQSPRVRRRARA